MNSCTRNQKEKRSVLQEFFKNERVKLTRPSSEDYPRRKRNKTPTSFSEKIMKAPRMKQWIFLEKEK